MPCYVMRTDCGGTVSLAELMSISTVAKDDYSWLRCTIPENSAEFASAVTELAPVSYTHLTLPTILFG